MTKRKVLLEKKGAIAIVTINNPPVNALDAQVNAELGQVFDELKAANEVLAVVVTGAGEKAFMAGADISQFLDLKDAAAGKAFLTKLHMTYNKIAGFPCPVICAINGFAFGGGLELALACDIRIITDNTKVGLPEVSLGIYPGVAGTQRLPRVVGPGMAKKLIFTGSPIDAVEAYRIGLCDQIVSAGTVLDEAVSMAETIAARGPAAVRAAKKVINEGIELDLNSALALEVAEWGKLCETRDKEEGTKAFLEKRKPSFQGK